MWRRIERWWYGKVYRVPTVLQMEMLECGAASLAMILAYHQIWIPLERLREECGVNRNGSKASMLLKVAHDYGFDAKGYRWSTETLQKVKSPVIIHWDFNHFVVLEGFHKGYAYINDPASGRRRLTMDEFEESYTGIALQILPTPAVKPMGHQYSVMAEIGAKLVKDKWAALYVGILALLMVVPGLATTVLQQIFVDDVLSGKHPDWMFNVCLALAIALVVVGIMNVLQVTVLTFWHRKIIITDSADLFRHILRLPMRFFHQRYVAEIASRMTFIDSIGHMLSSSAATIVVDIFVALFFLALLLQYSVPLTLIGVGLSVVNLVVFLVIRRRLTDLNMRIQQDRGKEYGTVMNGLLMMETIKANGNEQEFFSRWAGYKTKVMIGKQEIALWNTMIQIVPVFLGGIDGALVMTLGGFSIMDGVLTAGGFIAFQSLMSYFKEPFSQITTLSIELQTTEMEMRRINDIWRYKVDSLHYSSEPSKVDVTTKLSGELLMKDVVFGYSTAEPPLLTGFSLHLKPGQWIAVVGASGGGKSTVAKLVTGLYEEWSGEVRFDGHLRRELSRDVIVSSISSVDQDILLFTGTVRQNITLFDETIPHHVVVQAAKDACIHDDILCLDGGYDAVVGEGGFNFSGGQRQRLEIARALARNPSILVLDEATSALDPVTELQVLSAIRNRGCACLFVAHRLSTIRDCDEIIVLDKGQIIERGTHEELQSRNGMYRWLLEDRVNKE